VRGGVEDRRLMSEKKKVDFFMPLYVGDYLADTSHLDAEQHGAYLLLLMAAWRRGGRLPNDPVQLARIACCPQRRWLRVWGIIAHFFQLDGAELIQRRVTRELDRAQRAKEGRSAGGRASAESRRQKEGSAQPKVVRSTPVDVHQNGSAHQGLSDTGFLPKSPESRSPSRTELGAGPEDPQPQPHPEQQQEESRGGAARASAPSGLGGIGAEARRAPAPAPWPGRAPDRSTWTSSDWKRRFGQAWTEAKGGIFYGRGGDGDSKACGTLTEILGSLPPEEVSRLQAKAGTLFEMYLAIGGDVARAEHPFSWFVPRFNQLRVQLARTGEGMGGVQRSELPESA
jgi:uncharacterized protein YdaU (DUF1376 family)